MQNAIKQFRKNIQSIRNLDAIYLALGQQSSPASDIKEILRAEIVLAVSALDCFVHDIVRNRIAHEADFNPNLGDKNPIDHQSVCDSIAFIENICEQLYLLITKSSTKSAT